MAKTLELVTIAEACELLGISRDTFYRVLKGNVVQVPSTTMQGQYDKQSILNRYAAYKGMTPEEIINKKHLS